MPVGVVHTVEDEIAWERAKEAASQQYPQAEGERYWKIVMAIYKKMTHYEPVGPHRRRPRRYERR